MAKADRDRDGDLVELCSAGARLRDLDPARFAAMLALIEAYVSIYDAEESPEAFLVRLAAATPRDRKASA